MKNFKWKWQDTVIVIMGLGLLGYALINYSSLPDQLPMHYGVSGEADRYWSKGSAIFFMGIFSLVLPLFLQFTRLIDPKKQNYEKFENAFAMTRLAVALVLDFVFAMTLIEGANKNFNAGNVVLGAIGLLFVVIGNYMPQVKDNYFVGIRTPWTLDNPEVWRKTHRFSGTLWVIAGLLMILSAFLLDGTWHSTVIISVVVLSSVVPVVYSWLLAQRLKS